MEIDEWIDGYKVRSFPWVDRKNIYINVQYYNPGSSLSQPPLIDKTALIFDDSAGRKFVQELTSTCVSYIAGLSIPLGGMAHIKIKL